MAAGGSRAGAARAARRTGGAACSTSYAPALCAPPRAPARPPAARPRARATAGGLWRCGAASGGGSGPGPGAGHHHHHHQNHRHHHPHPQKKNAAGAPGAGGRDIMRRARLLREGLYRVGARSAEAAEETEAAAAFTVEALWADLLPTVAYLGEAELRRTRAALEVAYAAHDGQKRKSGEPYIIHPVAVTQILGGMQMDVETIIAGLLHDTVEDTELTFEEVEREFGPSVAKIVEGETKVSKLGTLAMDVSKKELKAYDLRGMFIAMTEDVRIIIIKLADRLHNMRTLGFMKPEKQKLIAEETLTVFSPLARLLGLYRIKEELEELSFRYSQPEAYARVNRRLDELSKEQEGVIRDCQQILADRLREDPLLAAIVDDIEIKLKCKGCYSIHRKLSESGMALNLVRDVAQIIVVLHTKEAFSDRSACYQALGIVHGMWTPIPGKLKDYVATPKPNGYQSLNTTVLPLGSSNLFPLEIHFRTATMDRLAENGYAAEMATAQQLNKNSAFIKKMANGNGNGLANGYSNHNSIGKELSRDAITRQVNWLDSIKEWQKEFVGSISAREWVDTVIGDLLTGGVFVFTPDGDFVHLPKGATVIDFAYHIHSDVGNQMLMARVNGIPVHPSYECCIADVVDIVQYGGEPNSDTIRKHKEWLEYATTRSARHKISKFLKEYTPLVTGGSMDGAEDGAEGGDPLQDIVMVDPYEEQDTMWFLIRCGDRYGLLSDVSRVISSYAINIKAYSGGGSPDTGKYYMNFELVGPTTALDKMCVEIGEINGITGYSIGCNWSAGKQEHRF